MCFDDYIWNNNILTVSNLVANTTLCAVAEYIWNKNKPEAFVICL